MGFGIPIIGDIIDSIGDIVSEVVVDKDKKAEISLELAKLADAADARISAEVLAQIEVNKVEASSGSLFVAGWRPAVGWMGAAALGYSAILYPLMSWGSRIAGYKGDLPVLDNTLLITIMTGMLGLGVQRTYEKVKNVSTNDFRDNPSAAAPVSPEPPKKRKKILGIELPEKAPWA